MFVVNQKNQSTIFQSISAYSSNIFTKIKNSIDNYKLKINSFKDKNFTQKKVVDNVKRFSNSKFKYYLGLTGFVVTFNYLNSTIQKDNHNLKQTQGTKQLSKQIDNFSQSQNSKNIIEIQTVNRRLENHLDLIKNQQNLKKQQFISSQVEPISKKIKMMFKLSFDLLPHLILLGLMIRTIRNIRNPKKYIGIALGFGLWCYAYPKTSYVYKTLANHIIENRIMPKIDQKLRNHYQSNFKWQFISSVAEKKHDLIL